MKRCVVLSLCAVALTAFGISSAHAAVSVSLNLRYTDPADPSEGGTWALVATTDSQGVAGLKVRFDGGTMPPSGTVQSGIGHTINDANGNALIIGQYQDAGDPNGVLQTEFVYGQDPNDGLVLGVGAGLNLWNGGQDPLDGQNVGAGTWDNATLIATGAIADLSTRPALFDVKANEIIGGVVSTTEATIGDTAVRGDSLVTLGLEAPGGSGLLAGDADRDGDVDIADLGNLAGSLGGAGGWDDGDTDGDGDVDIADLGALAGNLGSIGTPPAIAAVPEPTSIAFTLLGLAAFAFQRRRDLITVS